MIIIIIIIISSSSSSSIIIVIMFITIIMFIIIFITIIIITMFTSIMSSMITEQAGLQGLPERLRDPPGRRHAELQSQHRRQRGRPGGGPELSRSPSFALAFRYYHFVQPSFQRFNVSVS